MAGARWFSFALTAASLTLSLLFAPHSQASPFIEQNPAAGGEEARDGAIVDDDWSARLRIVGGSTTSIGNFPWQVALVRDSAFSGNDFQRLRCGGELLTSRIVQTAAHCVFNTDPDCGPFSVVGVPTCSAGVDPGGDGTPFLDPNDVDLILNRTTLSTGGGEEFNAQRVYMASGYNPGTNDFDLAWIVLTNPSAQPTIKIAGPGEGALWTPGARTVVSGWGATSSGGLNSDTLKAATVPIISDADCGNGAVYGGAFHAVTMVCAGVLAGGTDSCQGDSGGPLQAPGFVGTTPVQRLVGVVSWGSGCAGPNKPGVYARVADPGISSTIQTGAVDAIESNEALPDAGSVIGSGASPNPPAAPKKKKCKKGKKLKKGKCVKKKKKKKKKKK